MNQYLSLVLVLSLCFLLVGTVVFINETTVWPPSAVSLVSDINIERLNLFQIPIRIDKAGRNSGTGSDYYWNILLKSVDLNNTYAQLYLYNYNTDLRFFYNIYDNGVLTDSGNYSIPDAGATYTPDDPLWVLQFYLINNYISSTSDMYMQVWNPRTNSTVLQCAETLYNYDMDWELTAYQYDGSAYDSRSGKTVMGQVQYWHTDDINWGYYGYPGRIFEPGIPLWTYTPFNFGVDVV